MSKQETYKSISAKHLTIKRLSQPQSAQNSTAPISLFVSARCFIVAALFILMASSTGIAGVQQNPIAGHWEGAIKLPSCELKLSVEFTDTAGKLSATITIPQQGAKDMPLSDVAFVSGPDNAPNKGAVSYAPAG